MGLDMYLFKITYIGTDAKGIIELRDRAGHKLPINLERISEIKERVGYWRKANAIHRWFVENVQDGEDDCGSYDVSTTKLSELLDIVKQVKADIKLAPKLLPTQEGFFFGNTEYGDDYVEDLNITEEILVTALDEAANTGMHNAWFRYHSS